LIQGGWVAKGYRIRPGNQFGGPAFLFVDKILKSAERGFKGMLMFAMPLYEVKYHEEDKWTEIADIELMDQLYRTYTKVTPAIKEMIIGNEVETLYGIYRLKLKGGEQSEMSAA
jgi:hypothetical protein